MEKILNFGISLAKNAENSIKNYENLKFLLAFDQKTA